MARVRSVPQVSAADPRAHSDRSRPARARARTRSPAIAALLSLLWPGIGQFYLGRAFRGWLFVIPASIALGVAAVWMISSFGNVTRAALAFLDPAKANLLIGFIVLSALLRAAAAADAGFGRHGDRRSRAGMALATIGMVAVLASHGIAGAWTYSLSSAAGRVFVPGAVAGGGSIVPAPAGAPDGDDGEPEQSTPSSRPPDRGIPVESGDPVPEVVDASPVQGGEPPAVGTQPPSVGPEPPVDDGRLTVLIIGVDSGPGRNQALTDTLMVLSTDAATGEAALISLPRDVAEFPLATGGTYRGKINSLREWAARNPGRYPGGGTAGLMTEVGHLIGIDIDHYAMVDLAGFERAVDVVGGVDVNNPRPIDDPTYPFSDGRRGFSLPAGIVHLDGETALAYARTRKGAGDNDFTRSARQQQIVLALKNKATDPMILPRLPEVVTAMAAIVRTSYPPSEIERAFDVANAMGESTARVVLGPPYAYHPPTSSTGGNWILRLDMDAVAELSRQVFGSDSRYSG